METSQTTSTPPPEQKPSATSESDFPVTLLKRRFRNSKIKITQRSSGIVQAYTKMPGNVYLPVHLDGMANRIGKEDTAPIMKRLQKSFVMALADRVLVIFDKQKRKTIGDAVERLFKNDPSATTLNLTNQSLGNREALALAEALKYNSHLSALNLPMNHIGDQGAIALADALKNNTTLAILNLWNNQIGPEGVGALANALAENHTLLHLDIERDQIHSCIPPQLKVNVNKLLERNRQMVHPSKIIRKEDTFTIQLRGDRSQTPQHPTTTTSASGDQLLTPKVERLLESLTDTTDPCVNLSEKHIDDQEILAIAEALANNTTLTTLLLNNNEITDTGAIALAEVLLLNQTLQTLSIKKNKIQKDGAMAFANALQENQTLYELNLDENPIGNEGFKALDQIEKCLETNCALERLLREQTQKFEDFLVSYKEQQFVPKENLPQLRMIFWEWKIKYTTLFLHLWNLTTQRGRNGVSPQYTRALDQLNDRLETLFFNTFEHQLVTTFNQNDLTISNAANHTLGRSLYAIWIAFFGFACPQYVKGQSTYFHTFEHLLEIAEGIPSLSLRQKESDPRTLFKRLCAFKENKEPPEIRDLKELRHEIQACVEMEVKKNEPTSEIQEYLFNLIDQFKDYLSRISRENEEYIPMATFIQSIESSFSSLLCPLVKK